MGNFLYAIWFTPVSCLAGEAVLRSRAPHISIIALTLFTWSATPNQPSMRQVNSIKCHLWLPVSPFSFKVSKMKHLLLVLSLLVMWTGSQSYRFDELDEVKQLNTQRFCGAQLVTALKVVCMYMKLDTEKGKRSISKGNSSIYIVSFTSFSF